MSESDSTPREAIQMLREAPGMLMTERRAIADLIERETTHYNEDGMMSRDSIADYERICSEHQQQKLRLENRNERIEQQAQDISRLRGALAGNADHADVLVESMKIRNAADDYIAHVEQMGAEARAALQDEPAEEE